MRKLFLKNYGREIYDSSTMNGHDENNRIHLIYPPFSPLFTSCNIL